MDNSLIDKKSVSIEKLIIKPGSRAQLAHALVRHTVHWIADERLRRVRRFYYLFINLIETCTRTLLGTQISVELTDGHVLTAMRVHLKSRKLLVKRLDHLGVWYGRSVRCLGKIAFCFWASILTVNEEGFPQICVWIWFIVGFKTHVLLWREIEDTCTRLHILLSVGIWTCDLISCRFRGCSSWRKLKLVQHMRLRLV